METFSALLAFCAGISSVTTEFPLQRPVTRSFDVFFDLRLNKRSSKLSWSCWFETPLHSFWRHCNECDVCCAFCGINSLGCDLWVLGQVERATICTIIKIKARSPKNKWYFKWPLYYETLTLIKFSNEFPWNKTDVFWLYIHRSLSLEAQNRKQHVGIDLDDNLALKRRKIFTWTNHGLTHWPVYTSVLKIFTYYIQLRGSW